MNHQTNGSTGGCGHSLLLIVIWVGVGGCTATVPDGMPSPTQKALIGKTKQDLLGCASVTPEERTVDDLTVLKYYKEAPLLEESFPGSKSSVPRIHRGCWATLGLKDDHVVGVRYDSVPSSSSAEAYCDEIFQGCLGP